MSPELGLQVAKLSIGVEGLSTLARIRDRASHEIRAELLLLSVSRAPAFVNLRFTDPQVQFLNSERVQDADEGGRVRVYNISFDPCQMTPPRLREPRDIQLRCTAPPAHGPKDGSE